MTIKNRIQEILNILTHTGRVDIETLVTSLDSSPATIRRELARMEQQGLLKRDRGGAFLPVPVMFEPFLDEVTFSNQIQRMAGEKTRIGALAASSVKDGQTVALAPGTTSTHVARFLQQRSNLTIVTNAVNIAMELCRKRDFKIYLTGGQMSGDWFAMVGARALEAITDIKPDIFFFGANGVSAEHGVTDRHVEEAAINRAMTKYSKRRVLVVDHLKLGQVAQCLVCPLRDVHTIITDRDAESDELAAIEATGVEILRA